MKHGSDIDENVITYYNSHLQHRCVRIRTGSVRPYTCLLPVQGPVQSFTYNAYSIYSNIQCIDPVAHSIQCELGGMVRASVRQHIRWPP